MFPQAYVYPAEMRATRDLLRRRCHLARKRAELLAPIHNTNSQYNLPEIGKRLANKANREEVAAWVRGRIKAMVGISCAVDVAPPDSIERTLVGKARRVIDQRKK